MSSSRCKNDANYKTWFAHKDEVGLTGIRFYCNGGSGPHDLYHPQLKWMFEPKNPFRWVKGTDRMGSAYKKENVRISGIGMTNARRQDNDDLGLIEVRLKRTSENTPGWNQCRSDRF